jgi:hypothetical protein
LLYWERLYSTSRSHAIYFASNEDAAAKAIALTEGTTRYSVIVFVIVMGPYPVPKNARNALPGVTSVYRS